MRLCLCEGGGVGGSVRARSRRRLRSIPCPSPWTFVYVRSRSSATTTVLPQPPRIADGKREGEKEERISLAFSRIGNGGRRIGGGGEGENRGERVKVSSPFLDPPSCYWTVADRTVGEKSPTYVHSEISAGEKKGRKIILKKAKWFLPSNHSCIMDENEF